MREKPAIPDRTIIQHVWEAYRLRITQVEFLPWGADANTIVYRITTQEGQPCFLKLRKGNFEETSLVLPYLFQQQGIAQAIAPLVANDGALWTQMDAYFCAVYPFVTGQNAYERPLSVSQWVEFGAALRQIHTLSLPHAVRARIPVETYAPHGRTMVRRFLEDVQHRRYADPAAAQMAAIFRERREQIQRLIERTEELAALLQSQTLEPALCHADIHAFNLLIAEDEKLYIVDWDNPILAPKERDLMFIGAGIGDLWNTTREVDLFFQGYGAAAVNGAALVYYRYERIIEDIAAFGEQILLTEGSSEDRAVGLHFFKSQFEPNGVLDIAYATDRIFAAGTAGAHSLVRAAAFR